MIRGVTKLSMEPSLDPEILAVTLNRVQWKDGDLVSSVENYLFNPNNEDTVIQLS